MDIHEILLWKVLPRWRGDFVRFLETGFGEPDFLAYLDTNSDAQDLADLALRQSAE